MAARCSTPAAARPVTPFRASEDRTRLGGGLGLKSPFGTFYAPNISPDPDDGIGRWSEADFVTAVHARHIARSASITFRRFPTAPISA